METLTQDQVDRWNQDGFLVLPNFVDAAACEELRDRAMEIVDDFDPAGEGDNAVFTTKEQERSSDEYFLTSGDKVRFFFEPEAFDADGELVQEKNLSINKIGHAMHDLDPVFDRFSHSDRLAGVARDIGFADPKLLQAMYIFKQPNIGGEVDCHTDHTFLWTAPQSVIGFWFAIEDATIDNGCMYAVPGGHRLPVRQRFHRDGSGGTRFEVYDPEPYPTDGLVPLEATAGTLILLHGSLPHLSYPNRSPISRHAYTLHVIEGAADYPSDNWLQRPELPMRGFASAVGG